MRQTLQIPSRWLAILVVFATALVVIPIDATPASARCVGDGNRGNVIGNSYSHEDDRDGSNNTCDSDMLYLGRYSDPPPDNTWCATIKIKDIPLNWLERLIGYKLLPKTCTTGLWVNYEFDDTNTSSSFQTCGVKNGSVDHCSGWISNWGY